jgi:hypothetical protein
MEEAANGKNGVKDENSKNVNAGNAGNNNTVTF